MGKSDFILGNNDKVPTEEEIKQGGTSYGGLPIKYKSMKAEARNMTTEIWVSDKFFQYSQDIQRHILNHEVAHNLSDELMRNNTHRWQEFCGIFVQEKEYPKGSYGYKNGWGSYREGLYGDMGATALSETLTRAITEYLDDPSRLKQRSIEAYKEIDEFMKKKLKKKQQVIPPNPSTGISLFNQALGNGVATGTMTEDWMLPSDWIRKEFPGYTIDELEEACEALRNDFIDDEAFFDEFVRYNNDRQLMDRIRREHPDSDYDEIVDDFIIPIALEVDRDFVEQYLEDHFSPMNEDFGDTVGTITAQFIVNNYMVGSRLRSTPTHKISKQERIDPKHTIIEFSGLTKRELESIEKILAKKGKVLSESYLTEADDDDSGDLGTEDFDEFESDEPAEEETEVTVDDIDNDEDADINEMYKKGIQFPILIEGFDEEGNAISMEEEDEGQYASEYGEAVVQQVEENKKFILSALDIYDLELFYESYDSNSNVKFTVTSSKELDSSILMNILKRYFNVEMDAKTLDYGEFTLNPVLDNKFIKIS